MYFDGSIGRITDYVKTAQLEQKWQKRKTEMSAAKSEDSKQVNDWIKTKRIGEIKNKMKSGKRLSHAEKEFLRMHDPKLYEKAMKIEKERDEFKRALANCKTKEEVRRVLTSKAMELQAEVQAVGKTKDVEQKLDKLEFISMRMMAIFDEHAEFVKTKEYSEMPNEEEENEENEENNEEINKEVENTEDSEEDEKGEKSKKSKSKKAKLTSNERIILDSYKLNQMKIRPSSTPTKSQTSTSTSVSSNFLSYSYGK